MREQAFVSAAAAGRLEVLKWLREQGCPWSATVSNAALAAGQRRCFEWLKREGCPTGGAAGAAAAVVRAAVLMDGMPIDVQGTYYMEPPHTLEDDGYMDIPYPPPYPPPGYEDYEDYEDEDEDSEEYSDSWTEDDEGPVEPEEYDVD